MATDVALAHDRLEIVLRDEQDDLQNKKTLRQYDVGVGTVFTAGLLHNLLTGPSIVGVACGLFLVLYILLRVWSTKNGGQKIVFRSVAFEENSIVLSSIEQTVVIPNDNIKHVHILNADSFHKSNDLAISVQTKAGESHEFRLHLTRRAEDRLPYSLLEKLKGDPYFTEGIEFLYPLLFLRYPETRPFSQDALNKSIGLVKIEAKIERNYEFDQARLRLTKAQGLQILLVLGGLAILYVTNTIPKLVVMLPMAALHSVLPFMQKPLNLILGHDGIGIGRSEQVAHVISYQQLQSLRFTPSRIDADRGLIKASLIFLNGDELNYNLIVKKQEDKDALQRIAREFKELKHGD